MKTTITTPRNATAGRITLMCAGLMICTLTFSQSGPGGGSNKGGKLEFKNPTLVSGTAGKDNAVYKFPKAGGELDALVKIKARSSALVQLINIDLVTSGFDKAWQPQVGYNNNTISSAGEWWMDFEISFTDAKSGAAVSVDTFNLSAIDIDGNGDKIREYVSFYNLKSYTLEKNSILSITNILGTLLNGVTGVVGKRFDGPTMNLANIDTSGTSVMVTANYQNIQTFTVRLGGVASGANSATERMYSMYFQSFKYTQPSNSTLPVKLTAFDTKLNDSKVDLTWKTAEELNFSHFVIERSTDGTNYKEIAMVFADAKESGNEYEYKDAVGNHASGLMYYRLKMVDRDGSGKYSKVRIVKFGDRNSLINVTAYPNPTTNELRITIPAAWQNKAVTYEMINLNGVIVKQQVNQHASQTETIEVSSLQAGNYMVRLRAGDETAVQLIAKR